MRLMVEAANEERQRLMRIDAATLALCLKKATRVLWNVACYHEPFSMHFLCWQEQTDIKLATPTMTPSYWTTATIREHADIIAELYKHEMAGRDTP